MLLSQTGRYALRAALYLGSLESDERATADEIAELLDVPRNYLSKILHLLARRGVLTSTRGPGGGFALASRADRIPLAEILEPIEPQLGEDRRCLLGQDVCSSRAPCAVHDEWQRLASRIDSFLNKTTLGTLQARKRPRRRRSKASPRRARKTRKGGSR